MNEPQSKPSTVDDLAELSRRTGLVVGSVDSKAIEVLFAQLEKHDLQERAETFGYLRNALNETRASLGAGPAYRDD